MVNGNNQGIGSGEILVILNFDPSLKGCKRKSYYRPLAIEIIGRGTGYIFFVVMSVEYISYSVNRFEQCS